MAGSVFSGRFITAISLFSFLIYLLYRVMLIFYPQPDAGGVEGNIIYFVQRLLEGQSLYTDPELPPYAIAQYSPLYYYIVAGVSDLFGFSADDLLPLYMVSRSVSLFLNLLFIVIIFLTARNIFNVPSNKSICAAVAAFIFLEITSFSRPDSLNHVFFLLTLYVFMGGLITERQNKKTILIAALLSSVALFSKQTSFILPVIIGSWLLYTKKTRETILFGLVYLLAVLFFIFPVYLNGDLGYFYKNVVQGINNGISVSWFRGVILADFYFAFGLLFVPAYLVILYRMKREKEELQQFTLFAMVVLFVLLNAIAIKNGSNPGYFTEWWSLLFILIAYSWPQLSKAASAIDIQIPASIVVFVFLIKVIKLEFPLRTMLSAPKTGIGEQYKKEKEIAGYITHQLSPTDKYCVFTNYNTAESYLGNMLFRQAVAPQMDIIGLAAYQYRKYDYSDLNAAFTDGRIKWMLMRTTGPQKQFFEIKLDKFELDTTMNGFNIYKFQP